MSGQQQTSQYPASLAEALAVFQADPPKIRKDAEANAGTYKYKYADLADVSGEILPRLGRLGLSFTALPTMREGEFVLAYTLQHVAGDKAEGVYPLPVKGSPQQIGSAITYARRYCLCAVTGVAPDSDDDDAAAAEHSYRQSAGDVFEQAAAARPQRPQGQRSQPARTAAAQETANPADDGPDEAAQEYASEAHEARTLRELELIHKNAREAGKLGAVIRNPATSKTGQLALYLDWRRRQLKEIDDAWQELNAAAGRHRISIGDLENELKIKTGIEAEAATPAQIREFIASLDGRAA